MMSNQESEMNDSADDENETDSVKELRKFINNKGQGVDTFAADR